MIYNNQLPPTDLTFVSRFVNLWVLSVGNYYSTEKEQEQKRKYNRFHGSLKSLQKLTKLRLLTIIGTDVDGDLEHLPNSITSFSYEGSSKIENKLKKHDFNLQKWRKNA